MFRYISCECSVTAAPRFSYCAIHLRVFTRKHAVVSKRTVSLQLDRDYGRDPYVLDKIAPAEPVLQERLNAKATTIQNIA